MREGALPEWAETPFWLGALARSARSRICGDTPEVPVRLTYETKKLLLSLTDFLSQNLPFAGRALRVSDHTLRPLCGLASSGKRNRPEGYPLQNILYILR